MSDKKYVVPDGMLKAAMEVTETSSAIMDNTLKAVLRWLDGEMRNLQTASRARRGTVYEDHMEDGYIRACGDVRNLYLAPYSKVPEEIKDLIIEEGSTLLRPTSRQSNDRVLEAYRRGKNAR